MSDPMKLQGKIAVVTGGASGIGAFIARRFADHGALAVVIADIQDKKGRDVAASIDRCTYVHCDVTHEDQVKALVNSTLRLYGRLDIMHSNAGVIGGFEQTILDLDLSLYDKVMAVNTRGMAACVKHAAHAMVDRGVRGSIICTASLAAESGTDLTAYTMSKHAVLGLVRSASRQLAARGVRVNCVSPGAVATPLLTGESSVNEIPREEVRKMVAAMYSGANGVLTEKHVADAVVFLASEDSEFVTGRNLVVDGGIGIAPSPQQ